MEFTENDVLFTVGDYPPLLRDESGKPEFEVAAVCLDVRNSQYGLYKREEFVFKFEIVEPECFHGQKLECYAPWRKWKRSKYPPKGSKISKMVCIAAGNDRVRKITKSVFVGKLFRCRVRPTSGDAPYSVIDIITECLAG